jgi:nitrogen fixation/metabolism regulation signal transduction histidine kinase
MPEGGDLGVGIEERDGVVTVEVRDSGVGITSDVAQRLFEPYFTTRSKGTGLGLAIVRRVVEEMGGEVELRNRDDGHGALARITLPRFA